MAIVAGIDGCRTGWICASLDTETRTVSVQILLHIEAILPTLAIAMIDIPIGLPNAGARECDTLVRCLLKSRGSSVFPAPIRPMLAAETYVGACGIGTKADGRKISKQTWFLLPKIREVDAFLLQKPERMSQFYEVHPELSFCAWNDFHPMSHSKKTAAGRAEREALVLSRYGEAYRAVSLPKSAYRNDDLLDAFAALWTAERHFAGTSCTYPALPPRDETGLPMAITA